MLHSSTPLLCEVKDRSFVGKVDCKEERNVTYVCGKEAGCIGADCDKVEKGEGFGFLGG